MSNIYSIQLLNDLHNYFPDILYTDRIRNTQDLLGYIRQVAQTNPYDRGLHIFNRLSADRIYIPNTQNSIITGLINRIIGNINELDDLDNVVVYPTSEQIMNATTVYHVNTLQDDICTICQDNIQSNEVRRITHCRHYFHKNCIDTWFERNVHCPTCRYDIR